MALCWRVRRSVRRDAAGAMLGFTSSVMASLSTIRENLRQVRQKIETAARCVSRKPEEVRLIGVSKTHPAEAIREAYDAGLRHFGENRVQEWEGKLSALADLSASWHLIGHLQSNKAARAAKAFHSVDSVDDWSLAQRLDRAQAEKISGEKLRVLIEVHMGGEETKSGVSEEDLPGLAERVMTLAHLAFAGLMCIPTANSRSASEVTLSARPGKSSSETPLLVSSPP